MLKISLLISLLCYTSLTLASRTIPSLPEDCFEDDVYCSSADVVERRLGGENKKVINVSVFALITEMETKEEILNLFFDFDKWGEYARREGSGTIKYKKSYNMGNIVENGRLIRRHYANYKIKAPFPINRMKIRAVGYYWEVAPYQGALTSINFANQTEGTYQIPGEDVLHGGEGFKYTEGEFHILPYYDEISEEECFLVYFTSDIIPSIDFLPQVAAPYVENGLVAVLKGMLDL